jgi:cytochrome P450
MAERRPVMDWARDFDHLDFAWVDDPYAIWDRLREECPVAHTDRYQGVYLPTRYEDVRAIALDHDNFSSRQVIVRDFVPARGGSAPPITNDPPRHQNARRALLPAFTPAAIDRLVQRTREICNELIDGILARGNGRSDAAVDYAQHVPVRVIALLLGVPDSDGDLFRHWVHQQIESGVEASAELEQSLAEMADYFGSLVAERQRAVAAGAEPGTDVVAQLLQARYDDGTQFTTTHVVNSLRLLLVAGIDTTWSSIGAALWHLGRVPADRTRLVAEPALIPTAIEEFLRAYAPVTMARKIKNDTVLGGCTYRAGEMVLLPFPAANRDPRFIPDPDKVVIDRKENRHAAFGLGIHRCIGSNLARMELRVALEEWLRRIPDFALDGPVTWSAGQVRGPRSVPLRLSPCSSG